MGQLDGKVGGSYEMSLYYPDSEPSGRGKSADREDRYTARFIELTPPRRIVGYQTDCIGPDRIVRSTAVRSRRSVGHGDGARSA